MFRRIINSVLAFIVGFVLVFTLGAVAYGFDKEANIDALNINNLSYDTYIQIRSQGTALGTVQNIRDEQWYLKEGYYEQYGSGYIPFEGIIITAAHVVHPDAVSIATSSGTIVYTSVFKVLTNTILVSNFGNTRVVAWIHYISHENDVAILKYNNPGIFQPTPYSFLWKPEMMIEGIDFEVGDAVAVVVRQRDQSGARTHLCEVRVGNIVKWGPTAPREDTIAWLSPNDITTDVWLIPGDSGSPMFVFKNGVPIYVGVARAFYYDGMVYFSYFAVFGYEYRFMTAR